MHHAASQPNAAIIRYLLSKGALIHVRNRENHTSLFVAADAGFPENVSVLKGAGADLHPDEMDVAKLLKHKAEMDQKVGNKQENGPASLGTVDYAAMKDCVEAWTLAGV